MYRCIAERSLHPRFTWYEVTNKAFWSHLMKSDDLKMYRTADGSWMLVRCATEVNNRWMIYTPSKGMA